MHGGRVAAEHSTRVRRAACLAAACAGLAALVLLRRAEDVSPALPRPCAGDSACAAPPLPCPLPYTSDTRVAPHLPLCASALGEAASSATGEWPLVHDPDTWTLRAPVRLALDLSPCWPRSNGVAVPAHSVVVSAHNAGGVLERTLSSLLSTTSGTWELLLTLDGCTDDSLAAALRALGNASLVAAARGLVRARVLEQPTAVWETSSDNAGMARAHPRATHLLLVQADMVLTEPGWNVRLALPTTLFEDVWAVSARDAHNAALGRGERTPGYNITQQRNLDVAPSVAELAQSARVVSIRDVVNRGPLALRADVARALGFLNERDFYIRHDEHDLVLRAHERFRLKACKYLVGWYSPPSDGASRAKHRLARRSAPEWAYLLYRTARQRRAARRTPLRQAARMPPWDEERAVDPNALQLALERAEAQAVMTCAAEER